MVWRWGMGGVVGGPRCRHGLDASSCNAEKKFEEKTIKNEKRKRRKKRNI